MGAVFDCIALAGARELTIAELRLDDLSPLQRLTVLYVRLWRSGAKGRALICEDLASRYGPAKGHAVFAAFTAFLSAVDDHADRSLVQHPLVCPAISADEAALAVAVSATADDRFAQTDRTIDAAPTAGLTVAEAAATFGWMLSDAERDSFDGP